MLTTSLPLSSDTSESGLVSPPFLTAFEMNALDIYALPTHASKPLRGVGLRSARQWFTRKPSCTECSTPNSLMPMEQLPTSAMLIRANGLDSRLHHEC